MKYCKLCLQPDTRPNDYFTKEGICVACSNYHINQNLDYASRFRVLQEVLARHLREPGQFFDCIIGVSGGKDSTRQALWVRDKLVSAAPGPREAVKCLPLSEEIDGLRLHVAARSANGVRPPGVREAEPSCSAGLVRSAGAGGVRSMRASQ